jgi:hypothetical protein
MWKVCRFFAAVECVCFVESTRGYFIIKDSRLSPVLVLPSRNAYGRLFGLHFRTYTDAETLFVLDGGMYRGGLLLGRVSGLKTAWGPKV